MRPITFILISLALVLSGVAALMARKAITQKPVEAVKMEPMTKVLVANRDIPTGSVIAKKDIRWQKWPQKAIGPNFISGGDEEKFNYFVGKIAISNIFENEVMAVYRTVDPEKTSVMAGIVSANKRAYGVPVSLQSGMTGFILPGDMVDVVLVGRVSGQKYDEDEKKEDAIAFKNFSETILTNIKVLAVDDEITSVKSSGATAVDGKAKKQKKKKKGVKSLTLEVTPEEAEILAVAMEMGELRFVLRPVVKQTKLEKSKNAFTSDIDASDLLNKMIRGKAPKKLKSSSSKKTYRNTVKIYRGGKVVTQSVGP
jgi:pilus assembly protein CpaB